MAASNIYVTHVVEEEDLLKIWGQTDRMSATYVEKMLDQHAQLLFSKNSPDPTLLRLGTLCYVIHEDKFHRARIVSSVSGSVIKTLLVDYGRKVVVNVEAIRMPFDQNTSVLVKIAEQAQEFYLEGVIAPQGGWVPDVIRNIEEICRNETINYELIPEFQPHKVVRVFANSNNLALFLVKNKMAREIKLNMQIHVISTRALKQASMESNIPKPMRAVPPNPNFNNFTNVVVPKMEPPGFQRLANIDSSGVPIIMNQVPAFNRAGYTNVPANLGSTTGPSSLLDPAVIQAVADQVRLQLEPQSPMAESLAEPQGYITEKLHVGRAYHVYVSCIDDGPWAFSIQTKEGSAEVTKLSEEMHNTNLTPIKRPIVLGQPCIAESGELGIFVRGVVVNITHHAIKVFFVDVGSTEELPVKNVYNMLQHFFKIHLRSQKFALSGLEKVKIKDQIKALFEEVVLDETLIMRVVTTDDALGLQTCELFLRSRNIKEILNEKVREQRLITNFIPEILPAVGATVTVVPTWIVDSCKFYVHLLQRTAELEQMKNDLAERASMCRPVKPEHLRPGLPCLSQFKDDDLWYRARVTALTEDGVTVLYVDYGNTDTVEPASLRMLEGGYMSQTKTMAIQCALSGFDTTQNDEEMANRLEHMILEKELDMQVVSMGPKNVVLVHLFDNGINVGQSLMTKTSTSKSEPTASVHVIQTQKAPPAASATDEWKNTSTPAPASRQDRHDGGNDRRQERLGGRTNSFDGKQKDRSYKFSTNERQGTRPWGRTDRQKEQFNNRVTRQRFNNVARENWRDETRNRQSKDSDVNSWQNKKTADCDEDRGSGEKGGSGGRNRFGDEKSGFGGRNKFGNDEESGGGKGRFGRSKFGDDGGVRGGFSSGRSGEKEGGGGRSKYGDNGGDRGGFAGKGKFGDGGDRPRRTPISREDLAPAGSVFEKQHIDEGTTLKVSMLYYVNPAEFYLQTLHTQDQFKQMMNNIQLVYANKFWLKDPPQQGDIVMAKFASDGVLYRAEVLTASPITVRFVDYGNTESVDQKAVWAVDKRFLELPRQLVKCGISGVAPAGDRWPVLGGALDSVFDEVQDWDSTFLSCTDGVYQVRLHSGERDIAEQMVADGHAVKTTAATDGAQVTVFRPVDLSLLVGKVLKLYIPYVDGVSMFYVHLDQSAVSDLQLRVDAFASAGELAPIEASAVAVGVECIASPDSVAWYRGRVVEMSETGAWVQFLDYGDSAEVSLDKIMQLPTHLSLDQTPALAVECTLEGDSSAVSDETQDQFKDTLEAQSMLVSIAGIVDDRLSVTLYNLNGKKAEMVQDVGTSPPTIETVPDTPLISQATPVVIAYFKSPRELYLNRVEDTALLGTITEAVFALYEKGGDVLGEEEPPVLCATKSAADEQWYRARLLQRSAEGCLVEYLDYGNSEEVEKDCIKVLDASLCLFHKIAVRVCLDLEYEDDNEERIGERLSELTAEWTKELVGHFVMVDGTVMAELMNGTKRLSRMLVDEGLATSSRDLFPHLNVKEEIQVFVSHIDNPGHFWIHRNSIVEELDGFQEFLNQQMDSLEQVLDLADCEGQVVAALFSEDEQWYRAKITSVTGTTVQVHFIDYGNTASVDASEAPLKSLSDELKNKPVFAECVALEGNWDDSATTRLEELVSTSEDSVTMVVLQPGVVDLIQRGQSLTKQLRECPDAEQQVVQNELHDEEPTHSDAVEPGTDDDKMGMTSTLMDRVRNETDEEKRVKIGIVTTEGFKSDDEKVTPDSGEGDNVNVTDELMAEVSAAEELAPEVNAVDELAPEVSGVHEDKEEIGIASVEETALDEYKSPEFEEPDVVGEVDNSPDVSKSDEEKYSADEKAEVADKAEAHEEPQEEEFDDALDVFEAKVEVVPEGEAVKVDKVDRVASAGGRRARSNADKIVAGSIARGISEEELRANETHTNKKLDHSEKIVPGSVSRGGSLEVIATGDRVPAADTPVSVSAPCTPSVTRRDVTSSPYNKMDHSDRVVPGAISRGSTPEEAIQTVKVPPTEKLLAGAVCGEINDKTE